MINMIVATSMNRVIGSDNELPWIIPEDLKRFRELTTKNPKTKDNIIVMGWKTWESIGARPLPNRTNVILSRRNKPVPRKANVILLHSPQEVLNKFPKEINIIGGESIFRYFLPLATHIYKTIVNVYIKKPNNLVYFPKLGPEWKEVYRSEKHKSEEYEYEFTHLINTSKNLDLKR